MTGGEELCVSLYTQMMQPRSGSLYHEGWLYLAALPGSASPSDRRIREVLPSNGCAVISGKPGTVIYYYGSTSYDERLWLIADVLTNAISDGTTVQGKMYEAREKPKEKPRQPYYSI